MLPLVVLAGLVGAGVVINRNERADIEEAPEDEREKLRPRKDGSARLPHRPPRTKKAPTWDDLRAQREQKLAPRGAEALVPGPLGEGPLAHFTESQVGSISQAPAQLARVGAAADPAHGEMPKREVPTSGPPQANRLTASPMASVDVQRNRFSVPNTQEGVAPFASEREKPMGENSARIRRAAIPRDVDKLRGAGNPKDVKAGRFVGAPFGRNIPGTPGTFTTERRIGDGSDSVTHFGTGAAAVRRGADVGEFVVPDTQRSGEEGQLGPAARTTLGSETKFGNPSVRDTSPHILSQSHEGFLAGGPRERDRTDERAMYDCAVGGMRDSHSPILGAAHAAPMGTRTPMRRPGELSGGSRGDGSGIAWDTNRKALLSQTPRHFGELQIASNPPKQTVYEPEPLRTTMRETSIHDTHEGMIRGMANPGEVRSPDVEARRTVRETIGDVQGSLGDGRLNGTVSLTKPPVYDPNDVFDTTVKETTESNAHMGHVGAKQGAQGPGSEPTAPATQRAFDADCDRTKYFGIANRERSDAYRAHTAMGGAVAWSEPGTTNRDMSACTDYRGGAISANKAFPADDMTAYTRVIGDAKEKILKRRDPNGHKEILPPSKSDLGVATWSRDTCTDRQNARMVFQNQHRSQQMVQPDTCDDTRGGRPVHRTGPDPSPLRQLATNPYAIANKGVVQ